MILFNTKPFLNAVVLYDIARCQFAKSYMMAFWLRNDNSFRWKSYSFLGMNGWQVVLGKLKQYSF